MKKSVLLLIAILLCFAMCFTGCESSSEAEPKETKGEELQETEPETFLAEILQINGKSVLVEPLEDERERKSSDQISFGTGELEDIGAEEGDIVKITYDGLIMESYPAQIHASKWEIHEKACTGGDMYDVVDEKPVIYLYPETETEISVKLTVDGNLTCTYPAYQDGWTVTAAPDGTLTDVAGQTYNYLYWEAVTNAEYDFSKGFCAKGEDTAAFLEDALASLGLSRREANEFIVYWLPLMEQNPYNIIAFQQEAYTESAVLEITPTPDTVIRVFMVWQASDDYVALAPQELTAPERNGFTVIEWGGANVTQP